jgi:hypothetical protein
MRWQAMSRVPLRSTRTRGKRERPMTIDEPSEVVLAPERRTIDVVPDDET